MISTLSVVYKMSIANLISGDYYKDIPKSHQFQNIVKLVQEVLGMFIFFNKM